MYLQLILISHLFLYCNYIIFFYIVIILFSFFWVIILFSFFCEVLAAHFDFTPFFILQLYYFLFLGDYIIFIFL